MESWVIEFILQEDYLELLDEEQPNQCFSS